MKQFTIVGAVVALAVGFVPAKDWWQHRQAVTFVRAHNVVVSKPLSIFEWRGVQAMQTFGYEQTLTTLEREGYRTVFASFDDKAEAANEASYEASLNAFGSLLAAHHMELGIVAGDPSWTSTSEEPAINNVLAFARTYNKEFKNLAAVEFDIEPYTTGASKSQTAVGLASAAGYVGTLHEKGVSIGFTAPFWLAQDTNGTKAFLRNVGALPDGFVTIMDYRRATAGSNGSIALAAPFFALADAAHVRLIVGLDTTNASSADTFYGASSFDLRLAQYFIDKAEAKQPAYAGQAVNDVQNVAISH